MADWHHTWSIVKLSCTFSRDAFHLCWHDGVDELNSSLHFHRCWPSLPQLLQVTGQARCPEPQWPRTHCERCTARDSIIQRRSSASVRVSNNSLLSKSNTRALTCCWRRAGDRLVLLLGFWINIITSVTYPEAEGLGWHLHGVKPVDFSPKSDWQLKSAYLPYYALQEGFGDSRGNIAGRRGLQRRRWSLDEVRSWVRPSARLNSSSDEGQSESGKRQRMASFRKIIPAIFEMSEAQDAWLASNYSHFSTWYNPSSLLPKSRKEIVDTPSQ